ncbi:hypothetical protein ACO1O0_001143 [Amphichorda felina]
MSLSRAFTTRRVKGNNDLGDSAKVPHRSNTLHKPSSQQPLRHKISAPVQLVHTTNMLSYNAPDIVPPRPSRTNLATAKTTSDESDSMRTNESTPPTSPDDEPHDELRIPQPNHLSTYFMAPGSTIAGPPADAPAIPKRSPSHTKKISYDIMGRKGSVSRMSKESDQSNHSLTFSRSSSTSTTASSTAPTTAPYTVKRAPPMPQSVPKMAPIPQSQRPPAKVDTNPFGAELAQVTELAEEFSNKGRLDVVDEDEQYLRSRGLSKLSADDYLNDVHALMATFWPQPTHSKPATPLWI